MKHACGIGLLAAAGTAGAAEALHNWFDDPFVPLSRALPHCPLTQVRRALAIVRTDPRGGAAVPRAAVKGEPALPAPRRACKSWRPMTDTTPRISLHDDELPGDAARVVDDGLGEANEAAAPQLHDVRPLGAFAHDERGAVIGGAIGRTWGECCELQQLWVRPDLRGSGLGTALMRRFEAGAAARGCSTFYLETWSFQARPFYERFGYAVAHELGGFAPGMVKYLMLRRGGAPA